MLYTYRNRYKRLTQNYYEWVDLLGEFPFGMHPLFKVQTIVNEKANLYVGETTTEDEEVYRDGRGIEIWPCGNIWLGNWKDGLEHGRMRWFKFDGTLCSDYECKFGKCEGQVINYYSNKEIEIGYNSDDSKDGKFRYYNADGYEIH
jgi:hypothetical protein